MKSLGRFSLYNVEPTSTLTLMSGILFSFTFEHPKVPSVSAHLPFQVETVSFRMHVLT
jgi:hypothetical protein